MKQLSIIIVLYNEFDMVIRCLQSLYKNNLSYAEVVIIDNSTDKKGYQKVLPKFPHIRYIQNTNNVGFGKAVNIGLRTVKNPYALILTPDTMVLSNTIKKTLAYITHHADVAMVGCRIFSYPRKYHPSAFHTYPNLLTHVFEYNMLLYKIVQRINKKYHPSCYSENEHNLSLTPKHIIGGYMLLRVSAIKQIGYFDNQFHMYREETDLCKRLHDNHWQIVYLPISGLVHFGGATWKKTPIAQGLPIYMESTYRFFRKHYGKCYLVIAWILGTCSAVVSILFLFVVSEYKNGRNRKSQSTKLLPIWISIARWHVTKGIRLVLSI